MTSRLEELLSPDRLRDKWQEDEEQPPTETPPAARAPDHPLALVERLEALASARFPGAAGHGLPVLIGRLRQLVEQRDPHGAPVAGEDAATGAAQIRTLLNQIEDLVEALDLGRRH